MSDIVRVVGKRVDYVPIQRYSYDVITRENKAYRWNGRWNRLPLPSKYVFIDVERGEAYLIDGLSNRTISTDRSLFDHHGNKWRYNGREWKKGDCNTCEPKKDDSCDSGWGSDGDCEVDCKKECKRDCKKECDPCSPDDEQRNTISYHCVYRGYLGSREDAPSDVNYALDNFVLWKRTFSGWCNTMNGDCCDEVSYPFYFYNTSSDTMNVVTSNEDKEKINAIAGDIILSGHGAYTYNGASWVYTVCSNGECGECTNACKEQLSCLLSNSLGQNITVYIGGERLTGELTRDGIYSIDGIVFNPNRVSIILFNEEVSEEVCSNFCGDYDMSMELYLSTQIGNDIAIVVDGVDVGGVVDYVHPGYVALSNVIVDGESAEYAIVSVCDIDYIGESTPVVPTSFCDNPTKYAGGLQLNVRSTALGVLLEDLIAAVRDGIIELDLLQDILNLLNNTTNLIDNILASLTFLSIDLNNPNNCLEVEDGIVVGLDLSGLLNIEVDVDLSSINLLDIIGSIFFGTKILNLPVSIKLGVKNENCRLTGSCRSANGTIVDLKVGNLVELNVSLGELLDLGILQFGMECCGGCPNVPIVEYFSGEYSGGSLSLVTPNACILTGAVNEGDLYTDLSGVTVAQVTGGILVSPPAGYSIVAACSTTATVSRVGDDFSFIGEQPININLRLQQCSCGSMIALTYNGDGEFVEYNGSCSFQGSYTRPLEAPTGVSADTSNVLTLSDGYILVSYCGDVFLDNGDTIIESGTSLLLYNCDQCEENIVTYEYNSGIIDPDLAVIVNGSNNVVYPKDGNIIVVARATPDSVVLRSINPDGSVTLDIDTPWQITYYNCPSLPVSMSRCRGELPYTIYLYGRVDVSGSTPVFSIPGITDFLNLPPGAIGLDLSSLLNITDGVLELNSDTGVILSIAGGGYTTYGNGEIVALDDGVTTVDVLIALCSATSTYNATDCNTPVSLDLTLLRKNLLGGLDLVGTPVVGSVSNIINTLTGTLNALLNPILGWLGIGGVVKEIVNIPAVLDGAGNILDSGSYNYDWNGGNNITLSLESGVLGTIGQVYYGVLNDGVLTYYSEYVGGDVLDLNVDASLGDLVDVQVGVNLC